MAILSNFQANGQEAIKVAPPTQSGTLTYTGSAQSPSWTEYPASVITITSTPQTNAGTYNATAALTAGHVWADTLKGGQRNLPWTIGKASGGTIVLGKNAVELEENGSETVTVTTTGETDTITAVSSNSAVATVSVSGRTIVISDGGTEGTATITVSASGNYTYASSVSVSVEVSYLTIVTWSGGTDAQIVKMCQESEKGKLNLWDYWNIGDERSISLSAMDATGTAENHVAQNVIFVIVNKRGYTTTDGKMTAFIVQQKYCLNETGYMNSTATNVGSWNSCARRTWCNNVYKNAIPSSLREIFKEVNVLTAQSYNSTTNQISNDYFFLPAAAELWRGSVSGSGKQAGQLTAKSNLYEFNDLSRWEYYEDTTAFKKRNVIWWLRSPGYYSDKVFCGTDSTKTTSQVTSAPQYYNANNNNGIAPCGCIGIVNDGSNTIIPSWSDGTDSEIAEILNSHYNGELDISDYWRIGDERIISLSAMSATGVGESHRAQTIKMVILDFNHDNLTTPINGNTKAAITIGQKDCLMDEECAAGTKYGSSNTENGYMNIDATNSNGWRNCARRIWCNEVYYNAFPNSFKQMIKQVEKTTSSGGSNHYTIYTDTDKCFLCSEAEIGFNSTTHANGEGFTYQYYQTFKNMSLNKLPIKGTGTYDCYGASWWERSPYKPKSSSNSVKFCYGGAGSDLSNYGGLNANLNLGIAPACCL